MEDREERKRRELAFAAARRKEDEQRQKQIDEEVANSFFLFSCIFEQNVYLFISVLFCSKGFLNGFMPHVIYARTTGLLNLGQF